MSIFNLPMPQTNIMPAKVALNITTPAITPPPPAMIALTPPPQVAPPPPIKVAVVPPPQVPPVLPVIMVQTQNQLGSGGGDRFSSGPNIIGD